MSRQLLVIIGMMIFISCQKNIDNFLQHEDGDKLDYNRFFPKSGNEHPALNRIFQYLKKENSRGNFLPGFVKIAGYPRWDKTVFKNDGTCVIPMVSQNNTVITGMLIAELQGDAVKCRYNLLRDYRKMGEHSKAFVLSMIQFEKRVFGRTTFKILDHSLLGPASTIVLRKAEQKQTEAAKTSDDPCEVIEIWHDPTEEACHCSGDEYYTGKWYYAGDCFASPNEPYILPLPGGTSFALPGLHTGDGSGSGSNPPPYASTVVQKLQFLLNHLDMTPESSDFLAVSDPTVNEMYNYLYNNTSDDKVEIASGHIQKLATDADYLSFVTNYRTSSGNSLIPWWENQSWLSNSTNFHLDVTQLNGHYKELTAAEKVLIGKYPLQAYVINQNADVAIYTASNTGLPDWLNGKQDAFRHAFFQAINTRDVPAKLLGEGAASASQIVSMFAIAHESEVPAALQLEMHMDIFNNNIGITYCWNCWTTSNSTIANAIMNKLNNGELKYLSPLNLLASPQWPAGLNGITSLTILKWTNQ